MSEMSRRDLANACYYTQEGSWTGNSVHLEGIVLLSNNPAFVGVRGMVIPKHMFEAFKGAKSREAPTNLKPVGTGPDRKSVV